MKQKILRKSSFLFHWLKISKKQQLTKNVIALELKIPKPLEHIFNYKAGQYVTLKYLFNGEMVENDYSITSAPYEKTLSLAIKINSPKSSTNAFLHFNIGDKIEVSEPKGRFTLDSKPNEFRTILGFAAGIGITPIISHFKNILHTEPRTRLFLFYGNKSINNVVFKEELIALEKKFTDRLKIFYFFTEENITNPFFKGRIDAEKLNLIINQILNLDETDEESSIWDSVDQVLICGKPEMVKTLANACFNNGIPKNNIHYEFFTAFNEDIYPQNLIYPLIEEIKVSYKYLNKNYETILPDNKTKLLQQLLIKQLPVPYSCKAGICGSCICLLKEGNAEILENEFLTEKEIQEHKILACSTIILSKNMVLDFDAV